MTTKEKLEKALEALKFIEEHTISGIAHNVATDTYKEITTPRTETVEVRMWKCRDCGHAWDYMPRICPYASEDYCCNGKNFIELTGTYQRPIPEPEVWEGEVDTDRHWDTCIRGVPKEWIGKKVIVEVCE